MKKTHQNTDRPFTISEQRLQAVLKQEAVQSEPHFSVELHEKIMRQVITVQGTSPETQEAVVHAVAPSRPSAIASSFWWIAASVLLLAVGGLSSASWLTSSDRFGADDSTVTGSTGPNRPTRESTPGGHPRVPGSLPRIESPLPPQEQFASAGPADAAMVSEAFQWILRCGRAVTRSSDSVRLSASNPRTHPVLSAPETDHHPDGAVTWGPSSEDHSLVVMVDDRMLRRWSQHLLWGDRP